MLADEIKKYRLGLFPGGRLMLSEETDLIVAALRAYAVSHEAAPESICGTHKECVGKCYFPDDCSHRARPSSTRQSDLTDRMQDRIKFYRTFLTSAYAVLGLDMHVAEVVGKTPWLAQCSKCGWSEEHDDFFFAEDAAVCHAITRSLEQFKEAARRRAPRLSPSAIAPLTQGQAISILEVVDHSPYGLSDELRAKLEKIAATHG